MNYSLSLLLILLFSISTIGIIFVRKITALKRVELIIPTGIILGFTIFTFILNSLAFIIKGPLGIVVAYIMLIFLGLYVAKLSKLKSEISEPLSRKQLIFLVLGFLGWGGLIYWKASTALIGSDTNLYYSVAHTFIRGNFPPVTPWQPDLPLAYHLGAFELLGAFYFLTNLSFGFLHILLSALFIFCSSQIIIWIWKRHDNVISFLWGNLAAAIVLISFGFLKLAIPIFSPGFPKVTNLHQFFLWVRNLPTVNQSIEAYGAPVNLDTLIYFIFHCFGLAVVLSLIAIIINSKKTNIFPGWIIFVVGISALALINESLFVVSAVALISASIFKALQAKSFKSIFISATLLIICAIVVVQGGTITNLILGQKTLEKSVLIFPNSSDLNQDLISYHQTQTMSKNLPIKEEWLPLRWFHIGNDILVLVCISLFIFIKFSKDQKIILSILLITGISSLLAYNYIIPKYLAANGNRFLAFAFINFSLFVIYSLQNLFETLSPRFLKYFLFGILTLFILMPSILPPLAMLTKTRFGENKLIPRKEEATNGIEWVKNNLSYNSRIAVLDVRAPHPSGMARAMVQAGVFAPVFSGKVRVYTIEASPQYFDIAYFLNPEALRELKISFLLIDSDFFKTLPDLRKAQLEKDIYFRKIFDNSSYSENWEKVYEISDKYLKEAGEIKGSFKEFTEILPKRGKIYVDNEEHFNPGFLRRAIIFSSRERDLYYLPQSGVYLNVETKINQSLPREDGDYDYLVLGRYTNPNEICNCQTKLLWVGLKDEVYLWQKTY